MNIYPIALATVIWSTIPLKSHLDYRNYNRKLHSGAKMEVRHIPVTRVSVNNPFEGNRKLRKATPDINLRPVKSKPRDNSWKQNNRKFHRK